MREGGNKGRGESMSSQRKGKLFDSEILPFFFFKSYHPKGVLDWYFCLHKSPIAPIVQNKLFNFKKEMEFK